MRNLFLLFLSITFFISVFSKSTELDSLLIEKSNHTKKDTSYVLLLIDISSHYTNIIEDYDEGILYANEALLVSGNLDYTKGKETAYYFLGTQNLYKGNYEKALENYHETLKINQNSEDFAKVGSSLENIGIVHYYLGDLDKVLEYWKNAEKLYREKKIGGELTGLYDKLSVVYEAKKQLDTAIYYSNKAIDVHKVNKDTASLSHAYVNLGNIYYQPNGDIESTNKAKFYYLKALDFFIKNDSKKYAGATYINLSAVEKHLKNYDLALSYATKADQIYKGIGDKEGSKAAYVILSEIYYLLKSYGKAIAYKDSLFNMEIELRNEATTKITVELDTKYQTVEKQKQLAIQNLELEKNEAELQQHKYLEYGLIIGVLMLLILGVTVYIRYREKNKANELLTSKNEEIELKNLDIMDSIQYAKRIQHAILPPDRLVTKYLDESFILYTPKDIVSGDFYWMNGDENKLLFAAVDCTGHGVPGAFISIVGYNGLNKMIGELKLTEPAEILTNLNKHVADSLHQQENAEVKDGMDISLCLLDKKNKKLQYAGANNPLYIVRDNNIIEIKANKIPIGSYYFRDDKFYTNHEFDLENGDSIYSFTDGYPDQFGGEKGKKFMYGKFKNLLIEISSKPMDEQKKILIQTFNDWKGDLEQVDDICIIGVRV